MKKTKTVKK